MSIVTVFILDIKQHLKVYGQLLVTLPEDIVENIGLAVKAFFFFNLPLPCHAMLGQVLPRSTQLLSEVSQRAPTLPVEVDSVGFFWGFSCGAFLVGNIVLLLPETNIAMENPPL